jgi:hypothetical protein
MRGGEMTPWTDILLVVGCVTFMGLVLLIAVLVENERRRRQEWRAFMERIAPQIEHFTMVMSNLGVTSDSAAESIALLADTMRKMGEDWGGPIDGTGYGHLRVKDAKEDT